MIPRGDRRNGHDALRHQPDLSKPTPIADVSVSQKDPLDSLRQGLEQASGRPPDLIGSEAKAARDQLAVEWPGILQRNQVPDRFQSYQAMFSQVYDQTVDRAVARLREPTGPNTLGEAATRLRELDAWLQSDQSISGPVAMTFSQYGESFDRFVKARQAHLRDKIVRLLEDEAVRLLDEQADVTAAHWAQLKQVATLVIGDGSNSSKLPDSALKAEPGSPSAAALRRLLDLSKAVKAIDGNTASAVFILDLTNLQEQPKGYPIRFGIRIPASLVLNHKTDGLGEIRDDVRVDSKSTSFDIRRYDRESERKIQFTLLGPISSLLDQVVTLSCTVDSSNKLTPTKTQFRPVELCWREHLSELQGEADRFQWSVHAFPIKLRHPVAKGPGGDGEINTNEPLFRQLRAKLIPEGVAPRRSAPSAHHP